MEADRPGDPPPTADASEILIGISSCLLGEQVRHDGGQKRDRYIVETLARFFRFVPVCPEVEIGLGVPREPIRLVRSPSGMRLLGVETAVDHTRAMSGYARRKTADLARLPLDGFILKRSSPSCGLHQVQVLDPEGTPTMDGRGLFAAALVERFPDLPIEEEERLHDPRLRDRFLERVFATHRGRTHLETHPLELILRSRA